jgi:hypothetical protein
MLKPWIAALALCLCAPSWTKAQAGDPELRAGVDEVKAGDLKGGAVTLERVVERISSAPERKQELAAAYLYLGIAQAGLGQEILARAKFRQAFIHSRAAGYAPGDLAIDPALPERTRLVFEEVKREMAAAPEEPAPVAAPKPASTAPATIYVYWPRQLACGGNQKIACDDQIVAKMPCERHVILKAAPGTHRITFRDRSISGTFEAGQNHYVRCSAEGFPAHAALRFVDEDTAKAEIAEKADKPNEDKKTYSGECAVPSAATRPRKF